MNISLITSANTLQHLQQKIDVTANNIANMNTTGYKRSETSFEDLLTQNIRNQQHAGREVGRETPFGIRIGYGARMTDPVMRMEQGNIQSTQRELDFYIEGNNGWFRIARPFFDEEGNQQTQSVYTRDGNFQIQPVEGDQVRLVTAQGYPVTAVVAGEGAQPIEFSADYTNLSVTPEGLLQVSGENIEDQEFQLDMAVINRTGVMEKVGENQFRLLVDEDELVEAGGMAFLQDLDVVPFQVRQGGLEMANVDLSKEMTDLITAQRLLQFQARSISMADEMMGLANSIRG